MGGNPANKFYGSWPVFADNVFLPTGLRATREVRGG